MRYSHISKSSALQENTSQAFTFIFSAGWNALYGTWLPQSGYQPDDRPAFEMFLNDPNEHPEHKHIVDTYMPVKPL